MSQTLAQLDVPAAPAVDSPPRLRRSWAMPVPFVVAAVLAGASWSAGGLPPLTDLSFVVIAGTAAAYCIQELRLFAVRFGVGALVLFGGVLIWFCYDYFTNWFALDFARSDPSVGPNVVAKAACVHAIGIASMTIGLLLPWGRWLSWPIVHFPEPRSPGFIGVLVVVSFFVGLTPYALFTAEPLHVALWNEMVGGYAGGADWTLGRTHGNLNYGWGAYITLLTDIGKIGGVLGAVYALLVARTPLGRVIGWAIWAFWLAIAFGSGVRGNVLFMGLPVVGLLFLKHHAHAAAALRRISVRGYVYAAVAALALLLVIQFMAHFRSVGYEQADLPLMDVAELQGNQMFSAGLPGLSLIPDQRDFFYNTFPGATVVMPLPRWAFYFAIGPIPRAIWPAKPIPQDWVWYNELITGFTGEIGASTTISMGLLNGPYIRFGLSGVVQIGLLFGWLCGVFEDALHRARGRILPLLLSLALLTWMMRSFRGLGGATIYPVLIAALPLAGLIIAERSLSRARRS